MVRQSVDYDGAPATARSLAALPTPEAHTPPVEINAVRTDRGSIAAVASAFLLSRLLFLAVTVAVIGHNADPNAWNQWDSQWYLGIARHGYHWVLPGYQASAFPQSSLAFFPLLPLLVHLLLPAGLSPIAAGLIVANAAFLGALAYLYVLLRAEWGAIAGRRALLLLAFFPTAFFLAAPYTESLFLLGAAGSLVHARRGQPLRAGLFLAVAALTHSTAIILIVPLLLLLRPRRFRDWLLLAAPTAAVWAGYLLYLQVEGVPPAYLLTAQRVWHRSLTLPWMGFLASFHWLWQHAAQHPVLAGENIGNMIAALLFIALTIRAWPRLSAPLRAYCAGFWLIVLCTPAWLDGYPVPLGSTDRFILLLFPLAGWAGAVLSPLRYRLLLGFFVIVLAILTAVSLQGIWIG